MGGVLGAEGGALVRRRRGWLGEERRKWSPTSEESPTNLVLRLDTSLLSRAVLLATFLSIISIFALSSWHRCSTSTRGVSEGTRGAVLSFLFVPWPRLASFSASELLSDKALDLLDLVEAMEEKDFCDSWISTPSI